MYSNAKAHIITCYHALHCHIKKKKKKLYILVYLILCRWVVRKLYIDKYNINVWRIL